MTGSDVVIALFVAALAVPLVSVAQRSFPRSERGLVVAAFAVHVAAVFANLAVVQRLYGRGDMLAFMATGRTLSVTVERDLFGMMPEVVKLFFHMDNTLASQVPGTPGTWSMVAAATVLGMLLRDSILGVSMAMGMASFFGKVGLYVGLRPHLPRRWWRALAFGTLLVPSVVFWSAGLIKESFVITGLGIAAYGTALWGRRRYGAGLVVLGVGVVLTSMIKPYMVMTAGVSVMAFLYWSRAVGQGRLAVRPLRLVAMAVALLVGMYAFGLLFPRFSITNLIEESARLSQAGQRGGSSFSLGVDFTTASSATLAVFAVPAMLTAMFRPSLLDVSSPQVAVNAIETTAFTLAFLQIFRRHGFWGTLALPVRYPILGFCIPMVLLTALGVGMSTGNLGTMVRYRMPLVPFFAVWLLVGNYAVPAPASRRARKPLRAVSPARAAAHPHR